MQMDKHKKHKKGILIASIIIDLGILIYFKYANFICENLLKLANLTNMGIDTQIKTIALPIRNIIFYIPNIILYNRCI